MQSLATRGTPTERLVILALRWHNRGSGRADFDEGLEESEIFHLIGGTYRSMEVALKSLRKQAIIRRYADELRGWVYLLEGGLAIADLPADPSQATESVLLDEDAESAAEMANA